MRVLAWLVPLLAFMALVSQAGAQPKKNTLALPPTFVNLALCVHAGRHFTEKWWRGAHAQYALFGHVYYFKTKDDDIPHGPNGADGEGGWPVTVGSLYGGGLSFMVGTWNRAADRSSGRVPRVSSTGEIAAMPVATQVLAMWLIVQQDHGSFGEWPNTGRECGAPT